MPVFDVLTRNIDAGFFFVADKDGLPLFSYLCLET